ncbi:MAG: 3-isopropylmalate dehydrogenase [Lewinellaceae bacterium]|nr:3-isopropylmalate dehydrogenase [Lewinellaceae bacterium]HPR01601.1 3-isopropylmalate dehydrogenase [Saprospiraceae bacterium]
MNKKIAVLPGDGIGPEVIEQAIKVLEAIADRFHHQFHYNFGLVGATAIDKTGSPLPDETLETSLQSDAVLFGAIGDPKYDMDPNAKVRPEQGLLAIRKNLGLYCNIRPVKAYPSLIKYSPLKEDIVRPVDMVIFRELTGGIYFGEKGRSAEGSTAFDHCSYHVEEIERIAQEAFKAARLRRNKVTLVDKANVLETSRLWRDTVTKLAKKDYPEVSLDYLFVDNAAMQIILNPGQFDVILTENMFGDILSDEASVITGSIGMLPSASVGSKTSMYEPIHGSYPQGAGKDIANPIATILSAAMMLEHWGMTNEAQTIRDGIDVYLANGFGTEDLKPSYKLSCSQTGDLIASIIEGEPLNQQKLEKLKAGMSTII